MDQDRDKVLDAAAELFERYGYKKTTIEDIANEAGIGKGSVYLRFGSKEEIGLAWLKRLHDSFSSQLVNSSHHSRPDDRIRQFLIDRVMLRFDLFSKHRRSLDEAMCSLKTQLDEKKRAFHEEEAQAIAAIIVEGQSMGDFVSPDPVSDARTMILATNTLLPYSNRPDQIGDRASVLQQANALAKLLVRALEKNHV